MMKYALLSAPCVQHVFPCFWYFMVTWVAACRSHHYLPYHLPLALAQSSSNGWISLLQIAFFTPNIWKLLFLTLKQCLFLLQMTACLCPQRQIMFWKSFITSPPPIRSCPIIIKRLHFIVTDWMFNSKYVTPFILNFQTMPFLLQTTACLCRQRQITFWNLLAVGYSYRIRAILWMTADKWQILQYEWPAISFVNSKTVWCNGQCTQFIERSGFDSACCYVRFDQKHFIIFFNFLI